jgi:Na+-translocating ferredoxin:NAD+ oxidoreductase RNF subunit RnfB
MSIVLITALFALALAFVLGTALGFFKQFFAVPEDPLVARIRECLPGANCGACGYPGCDGYAAAVASGQADINRCSAGGKETAEKLAAVAGGGSAKVTPVIAVVACRGAADKALLKGLYVGVQSCRAAKISTGSIKRCSWGCQGFGDCVKVCKFGALSMGGGLPVVDYARCTGCKACMAECPQHIIRAVPKDAIAAIPLCSNLNVLKTMVARNCKAGCIKCELCVKNCPEGCIKMANGIPVVDYAKCTGCGTCTAKCPIKVMKLIQRDLAAV